MNDRDLVEALHRGNRAALKELFDSYSIRVYNVAYRMLQNKHDAEDVTQEVFLEAYKSLKTFRGESRLSTWLYRISVNRALNHQRKKRLQRWLAFDFEASELSFEATGLPEVADVGPDGELERKDTERIVQGAINALPGRQRTALVLHRYDELSHEEIAEVMGVSIASVESLLHRARQALARKLLPLKDQL